MQKDTEQAAEWQEIWERRGLFDALINAGRAVYNWFFRRTLRWYLTPHTTMLELGCGRASLSLSLCPSIERLVGVDISGAAVQQASAEAKRLGLRNASFMLDDCTDLALSERFDFVWSQGLLEHFDDPVKVVREHYRALAPGGKALLSVPYAYSYHTLWYSLTRPKALRRFWPWTEQRFFTRKELLAAGHAITPYARTFFLHPLPLGIIFLELRRPPAEGVDAASGPTPKNNSPRSL